MIESLGLLRGVRWPVGALICGLLAALVAPVPAVAAAIGATPAFAHLASDLAPDPAVKFGQLPNGLRYALLKNVEPRSRVSLRFAVAAGSFHETEDQRGLAHFLEHMAFNGSTHFPPGTLVEYFQRLGMSFGGDTNAYTSFDRTVYQLELPDAQPATLERAFTLFADYAGGLLLPEAEIDRERGIILAEKRARDSVGLRTLQARLAYLAPETLLASRLPIGVVEVIERAPRERFVAFYDAWYRPENITVVAVGDFDPAAVEAALVQQLSALAPRGSAPAAPVLGAPPPPTGGPHLQLHHEADAAVATVEIHRVAVYSPEPDTRAARLRDLPRSLAVRMLQRRLAILAKAEGSPFQGASISLDDEFDFLRTAEFTVVGQPAQWRDLVRVAEQELRRALEHGFTAAELAEAVAGVRNALEQSVKTAPTRQSSDLADALTGSVLDEEVFTTPADDLALFEPALAALSPEDCAAAFRTAWAGGDAARRLFVSGNLTLADPAAEVLAVYRESAAQPVTPPVAVVEGAFAYTDFGPAGAVTERTTIEDLGVTLISFSNGVRVNLKPTDFEAGRIRVNVRLGGGLLTQPSLQPGLARIAGRIFTAGGLGRHSIDDLQRLLAGETVGLGFDVDDDAFVFSGTTDRSDLLLQLQLLAAFVTDPGYRPEALRQAHKTLTASYTDLAHRTEGPLVMEVPRLLAGGDSRFGWPPQDVLFAYTAEDVRAWLAPALAQGAVEIAVVGDLELDATLAALAATFGALPARDPRPDYAAERRVAWPAEPLRQSFTVETETPKALVDLRWPATDGRDVSRARRFNLLATVLEDRLRVKLREELGATYSPRAVSSLSDVYPGYGSIIAQATVAPEQTRLVADALREAAATLQRDGVTEDELTRAKEPVLTSIRQSERSNAYWLGAVLESAQEQPQRLEWARTRRADIQSITAAELSVLAREFLGPERVCEFIVLPAAKPAAAEAPTPAPVAAPAPAAP